MGQALLRRMWITKGCRFAARERLRFTNALSAWTIALLSIYVVVVTLVLLAFSRELYDANEKWLNVIVIGISVTIISFSLLEIPRDLLGTAEAMNRSGLAIGKMYGQLSAAMVSETLTAEKLSEYENEYATVLADERANHWRVDYRAFVIESYNDFQNVSWAQSALWRKGILFTIWAQCYGLYFVAIFFPPMAALIFGSSLVRVASALPAL